MIFGVPLEFVKRSGAIPDIVEHSVSHLERKAFAEEGILRLAGSNSEIKRLKDQYNSGTMPDLSKVDVHAIAGVLKLWFRELPRPPLLSTKGIKEASSAESEEERTSILTQELANIPDVNYMTLKRLFSFCNMISANSVRTKMLPQNIAIVFHPTLNLSMEVITTLVMQYDTIFAEDRGV